VLCDNFETTKNGVFAKDIKILMPQHDGQLMISIEKININPNKIGTI
jgi:hypothetical protein